MTDRRDELGLRMPGTRGPAIQHFTEMTARRGSRMLLEGVWPAVGLGNLFGDPGTGKTAILLSLAGAIGTGATVWHGLRVHLAGASLFVIAEGQELFQSRVDALAAHLGVEREDLPVFVLEEQVDASDRNRIEWLQAAIAAMPTPPRLVVFDSRTSHTSGGAGSAYDAAVVGRGRANLAALARSIGALVVEVDHPGKSEKDEPAGSYTVKAIADAMWKVTRKDKVSTLTNRKAKDFLATTTKLRFRLEAVPGLSESFVAVPADGPEATGRLCPSEVVSLTAVSRPELGRGVTDKQWYDLVVSSGLMAKATYYRAKTRLLDLGFVKQDGALFMVTPEGSEFVSLRLTPVSFPQIPPAADRDGGEVSSRTAPLRGRRGMRLPDGHQGERQEREVPVSLAAVPAVESEENSHPAPSGAGARGVSKNLFEAEPIRLDDLTTEVA